MNLLTQYSLLDNQEKANFISHFAGLVLMIVCTPILINKLYFNHSLGVILCILVFCMSAAILLSASSLYHYAVNPIAKRKFRIFDHICIFLLIGGSYTAFISLYFNESGGWNFLIIQWLIILAGIVFKLFFTGKLEKVSTLSYVFLGWMVVFIYDSIMSSMSETSFFWCALGGASYTVGVIFYVWEKLPFNHLIWHLFVLGGIFSHYLALYTSH